MQIVKDNRQKSAEKMAAAPPGLAGWLMELIRRGTGQSAAQTKQMHLLETLSLGGKRELMLVSCAGERFLVGGGGESVETILRVNADRLPQARSEDLDTTCQ